MRLFQDRLVLDEERKWTDDNLNAVALKHFPNINKEKSVAQPILFSNWQSKNYIPLERGELRDYTKARHKVFNEEELDMPLVLFNEVLDHGLRIDRQVMKNLHVVCTMNPSTEDLKDRAATSPGLFNRCGRVCMRLRARAS